MSRITQAPAAAACQEPPGRAHGAGRGHAVAVGLEVALDQVDEDVVVIDQQHRSVRAPDASAGIGTLVAAMDPDVAARVIGLPQGLEGRRRRCAAARSEPSQDGRPELESDEGHRRARRHRRPSGWLRRPGRARARSSAGSGRGSRVRRVAHASSVERGPKRPARTERSPAAQGSLNPVRARPPR